MYNNKKVGLILPTRYKSERLPGKALIDICGKPNLERMIERALLSQYIDVVVLAISDKEGKEIIEWYDTLSDDLKTKVKYYIGEHDHIFKRTLNASKKYDIDIIVDTSHDCSFIDFIIIDELLDRMFEYKADYSSNVVTRSFPNGFDIQIYTREIYERIYKESPNFNQYWAGWNIFYCREDLKPKPRIINLQAEPNSYYPDWRLVLDTPEDYEVIKRIYKHFLDQDEKEFCFIDIIDYIKKNPDILKINNNIEATKLLKEKK